MPSMNSDARNERITARAKEVAQLGRLHVYSNEHFLVKKGILFDVLSSPICVDGLTIIELCRCGFTTVPPSVLGLRNLVHLSLADNAITELPRELFALRRLQMVDASFNQLSSLPDISIATELEHLVIHDNLLHELPWASLLLCQSLCLVSISNNFLDLTNVPRFAREKSLRLCDGLRDQYVPQLIADNIFLGGELASKDADILQGLGIATIVSFGTMTFADPKKVSCYYFAIDDESVSDIAKLFPAAMYILNESVRKGAGVLVHCVAGVSRSATIVAAYLMYAYGMTFEAALLYVLKRRYIVNPNSGFLAQLRAYDFDRLRQVLPPAVNK